MTFILFLYTRAFYGISSLHYKFVEMNSFYSSLCGNILLILLTIFLCVILTHFKQCFNFIEMHKRDNLAKVPEFLFLEYV